MYSGGAQNVELVLRAMASDHGLENERRLEISLEKPARFLVMLH